MGMRKEERVLESESLSLTPALLLLAAAAFLYLGERVAWSDSVSVVFDVVSAVSLLAAVALKLRALRSGSARAKVVHRLSLFAYGAFVVGAALFFASKIGTDAVAASISEGGDIDRSPTVLFLLSLFTTISAVAVVIAIEVSSTSMRLAGFAEPRRAKEAAAVALTATCALASALSLNFAVQHLNWRKDLSSAAPTKLSGATIGIVSASEKPVEVFLFFERGSPMLPELKDFYAPLVQAGATLVVTDHALDPELAKTMKVSRTATVGFRVGERTEKWFVGDDRNAIPRKLRRADEETRTRLSRITRDEKRVYFTVGHGERPDGKGKKGERLGGASIRKIARALNAKMRKLGFIEGLGRDIPDDAALVIIFGPTKRFLPEEQESLIRYLKRGGSLAIFLDPFVEHGLDKLLLHLRVKMSSEEVANDKEFIRRSYTDADHAIIFSNSFASHRTTRDLKKTGGRAAVLMLSAGHLERVKKADAKATAFGDGEPRFTVTMRSRPTTFVDVKRNRRFDKGVEKRRILNLGVVFEQKINDDTNARALVVSDSDAFADGLIPNDANQVFIYEGIGWLVGDDTIGGSLNLDADVPIRHTQEEDTFIFYGSTAAMPLAVAAFGFVLMRVRRRRRSAKREAS